MERPILVNRFFHHMLIKEFSILIFKCRLHNPIEIGISYKSEDLVQVG